MKMELRKPIISTLVRDQLRRAADSGNLIEMDHLLPLLLVVDDTDNRHTLPVAGAMAFASFMNDGLRCVQENKSGVVLLDYDDSLRIEFARGVSATVLRFIRSDVELWKMHMSQKDFIDQLIGLGETAAQIAQKLPDW